MLVGTEVLKDGRATRDDEYRWQCVQKHSKLIHATLCGPGSQDEKPGVQDKTRGLVRFQGQFHRQR